MREGERARVRIPVAEEAILSGWNLLIDHKLRPIANRQVGSHPTVMLDIGMPYPPWNRIQLVVHRKIPLLVRS